MRAVAALVAVALVAVAGVSFSFLGRSSDTPAATWVVIGFAALGLAAPFAWLALRRPN